MKKQIRRGCFETNSSSMHSLVIKKGDEYATSEECKNSCWISNNKLQLDYDMEFGRSPFELLDSFYGKLRYAIASLCGSYTPKEKADKIFENEFLPIIKEVIPDVTDVDFKDEDELVFYDENGKEVDAEWDYEGKYYYCIKNGKKIHVKKSWKITGRDYGCVDHQSNGVLSGFLKEHNISLKEFLTNKRYIVVIDGDEYCVWDSIKDAGLVDMDKIDYEYPPDGDCYDSYIWRKENKNEETDSE